MFRRTLLTLAAVAAVLGLTGCAGPDRAPAMPVPLAELTAEADPEPVARATAHRSAVAP